MLRHIAAADGFAGDLDLSRREASWAIKGDCAMKPCHSSPPPMIARGCCARKHMSRPCTLAPMTLGQQVTEDYQQHRREPEAVIRSHFLRDRLRRPQTSCRARPFARANNGSGSPSPALVLVRQMPGSAKAA